MAERLNLLNDLVKVRDAIFSQLNQEIGSISFDGESLSLTAVAKNCMNRIDCSHLYRAEQLMCRRYHYQKKNMSC